MVNFLVLWPVYCYVMVCKLVIFYSFCARFLVVYVLAIAHYNHDFSAVCMCRVFYVLYIRDVSIVLLNISSVKMPVLAHFQHCSVHGSRNDLKF